MDDEAGRGEVDARFLLANERTLLAWVRTALTLVAGGVAVGQLVPFSQSVTLLAAALTVAGLWAGLVGAARFRAADAALRRGVLPATGAAPYALVVAVTVAAAGALALLVL